MMRLNMSVLIRRHMKRSPTFVLCETVADLPVSVSPGSDEAVVGWYENPSPWEDTVVVFTSLAIYVAEKGRIVRTPFEEILGYETPKDNLTVTGVRFEREAASAL